jgi:hypothetical protein
LTKFALKVAAPPGVVTVRLPVVLLPPDPVSVMMISVGVSDDIAPKVKAPDTVTVAFCRFVPMM